MNTKFTLLYHSCSVVLMGYVVNNQVLSFIVIKPTYKVISILVGHQNLSRHHHWYMLHAAAICAREKAYCSGSTLQFLHGKYFKPNAVWVQVCSSRERSEEKFSRLAESILKTSCSMIVVLLANCVECWA